LKDNSCELLVFRAPSIVSYSLFYILDSRVNLEE
jgi:hypothetical protein